MRRSKFSGVFSFSADWTASRSKTHFFVWELPDGAFAVQELNAAFQPVAEVERISAKSFTREFKAEPNILAMPVVTPDLSHFEARAVAPQPQSAAPGAPQPIRKAAEPAANPGFAPLEMSKAKGKRPDSVQIITGKADQAPLPFPARTATGVTAVRYDEAPATTVPGATATTAQTAQATPKKAYDLDAARKAKVVETKLRETFRQTLLRLKRPRERKAALLALEQLAHTQEGITPSHKHMFRDFGVRLRQNSQPDLALLFTRKAVELAPEDDHAHFNLARILCSLGMYDEAAAHVATALSVSSEEPLYFKLLEHIRELKQARSAAKAASRR